MHRRLLVGLVPFALAAWPRGDAYAENTPAAGAATPATSATRATSTAAATRPVEASAGATAAMTARPEADEHRPGSVSCGAANRGALAYPAELNDSGPGYVVPEPWRSRGLRYGTEELIGLIERAAVAVDRLHPDSVLGVADLSLQQGGAAQRHRSHQSGRDVDLLYYALDPEGRPMPPDSVMPVYTRKGRAYYAESPDWTPRIPERYFDLARNWALVKALITDPEVEVMRVFVSWRIERWLIDYAKASQESEELIQRAQRLLSSPRDIKAHTDHMHVRIACPAGDVEAGRCRTELAPRRRHGRKWHWRVRCPKVQAPAL